MHKHKRRFYELQEMLLFFIYLFDLYFNYKFLELKKLLSKNRLKFHIYNENNKFNVYFSLYY